MIRTTPPSPTAPTLGLSMLSFTTRRIVPVAAMVTLLASQSIAQSLLKFADDSQGDDAVVRISKLLRDRADLRERLVKIETQLPLVSRLSAALARARQRLSSTADQIKKLAPPDVQKGLTELHDYLKTFKPEDKTPPGPYARMNVFLSSEKQKTLQAVVANITGASQISLEALFSPPFTPLVRPGGPKGPLDMTGFLESNIFYELPKELQEGLRKILESAAKTPEAAVVALPQSEGCYRAYFNVKAGDPDAVDFLKDNIRNVELCIKQIPAAQTYADTRMKVIGNALTELTSAASQYEKTLLADKTDAEARLNSVSKELAEVERQAQDRSAKTFIPPSAQRIIVYTLIAWGAIIIAVIVAILALAGLAQARRPQAAEADAREVGGPTSYLLFLEMITVFLLTGTILILGLSGRIQQEGLAALIGGISGYVLGRMHRTVPQQRGA